MTKILNLVKCFAKDEGGAAMIEYTVLLGIMLTGVIVTIGAVGTWINDYWKAFYAGLL